MAENTPRHNVVNPFTLKSEDGYVWLKGNLHSHTTNSDGKASPQERLDGYVNQGYDYLCLSDHRRITRVESVDCPDDFVLIQGAELHPDNPFGGQKHHFLCLNIHEDIDSENMPPQHVIDAVRDQDGVTWLAHPYWSSVNILRDTAPLTGMAGVEVFNTTCRCAGRGESGVHWDDWMDLGNRLYPALANDDSHALESDDRDTYQGWTMARVRDRSPRAIVNALEQGASYSSTGAEIHNISLRKTDGERLAVEATVECSESRCIFAICDTFGTEYRDSGKPFTRATFTLRPGARRVRFEVFGADGTKAWSNPFDLT